MEGGITKGTGGEDRIGYLVTGTVLVMCRGLEKTGMLSDGSSGCTTGTDAHVWSEKVLEAAGDGVTVVFNCRATSVIGVERSGFVLWISC